MSYPISRVKTWSAGDVLYATDLNSEFNNIITYMDPQYINDYAANNTQFRSQTSPGTYASPSLPTTLAGDIEALRYVIARMIGGTNQSWLDVPTVDLSTIGQTSAALKIGLEFEGVSEAQSSTTDRLAKLINQGAIINASSLSSADVVAADFDTTNYKFGSGSYTCGAGNILVYPHLAGSRTSGSISTWFRNLSANDYIAFNRLQGVELYIDSNGRIASKITKATAAGSETAKDTATITQPSGTDSGDTTFRNAILTWSSNTGGSDAVGMYKSGSAIGTQLSSQTITTNPGKGGNWIIGSKRNDPTWIKFSAMKVLPSSEASDGWTSSGTPNGAVSNGVLNIATTAGATGFYTKSTNIDLNTMTIEFKARLNSTSANRSSVISTFCSLYCLDASRNRSVELILHPSSITLVYGGTTSAYEMQLDTSVFHIYRITSAADVIKLYVDDVLVHTSSNGISDATATDAIRFGDPSGTGDSNSDWEYVAYIGTSATAPIAVNSGGNLDSFGVTSGILSAATITALQSYQVTQVFGVVPSYGITLPPGGITNRNTAETTTSATLAAIASDTVMYIPGDGVTKINVKYGSAFSLNGTTGTATLALGLDGDLTGADGTYAYGGSRGKSFASGARFYLQASRDHVLTPGLHTFLPLWLSSGTDTLAQDDEANQIFEAIISKEGKLQ